MFMVIIDVFNRDSPPADVTMMTSATVTRQHVMTPSPRNAQFACSANAFDPPLQLVMQFISDLVFDLKLP